MTRAEFDAALEAMRAVQGGRVEVVKQRGRTSDPFYLYGRLVLTFDTAAPMIARIVEVTSIAVVIGGYLTLHTAAPGALQLCVAVSTHDLRDPWSEELAAEGASS